MLRWSDGTFGASVCPDILNFLERTDDDVRIAVLKALNPMVKQNFMGAKRAFDCPDGLARLSRLRANIQKRTHSTETDALLKDLSDLFSSEGEKNGVRPSSLKE